MPDAQFNEMAEAENVGNSEDVLLSVFKRAFVRFWLLQVQFSRISVLAEQHDVDIRIGSSTTDIASLHLDLVGCRWEGNVSNVLKSDVMLGF